jgi:hypothetical protein
VENAAEAYRSWVRTLFTTFAREAGVADPDALARQLPLLYDGAGLSARIDHDPSGGHHRPGRGRRALRGRPQGAAPLSTAQPRMQLKTVSPGLNEHDGVGRAGRVSRAVRSETLGPRGQVHAELR